VVSATVAKSGIENRTASPYQTNLPPERSAARQSPKPTMKKTARVTANHCRLRIAAGAATATTASRTSRAFPYGVSLRAGGRGLGAGAGAGSGSGACWAGFCCGAPNVSVTSPVACLRLTVASSRARRCAATVRSRRLRAALRVFAFSASRRRPASSSRRARAASRCLFASRLCSSSTRRRLFERDSASLPMNRTHCTPAASNKATPKAARPQIHPTRGSLAARSPRIHPTPPTRMATTTATAIHRRRNGSPPPFARNALAPLFSIGSPSVRVGIASQSSSIRPPTWVAQSISPTASSSASVAIARSCGVLSPASQIVAIAAAATITITPLLIPGVARPPRSIR